MPLIIEDSQKLSRDAEEYVHAVITLTAPSESQLEPAALRVVGRLSAILNAMFAGVSAADAAHALRPPQPDNPTWLSN